MAFSLPTANDISPLQPANAEDPMLVTLSGIVTLASPLQPKNASTPMLVTLSGIVTLVNPLHFLNAEFPIPSTNTPSILEGIVTTPDGSGETDTTTHPFPSSLGTTSHV